MTLRDDVACAAHRVPTLTDVALTATRERMRLATLKPVHVNCRPSVALITVSDPPPATVLPTVIGAPPLLMVSAPVETEILPTVNPPPLKHKRDMRRGDTGGRTTQTESDRDLETVSETVLREIMSAALVMFNPAAITMVEADTVSEPAIRELPEPVSAVLRILSARSQTAGRVHAIEPGPLRVIGPLPRMLVPVCRLRGPVVVSDSCAVLSAMEPVWILPPGVVMYSNVLSSCIEPQVREPLNSHTDT